ncbi:MAG: SCO family protein [Candidatus Binatia bacterium]
MFAPRFRFHPALALTLPLPGRAKGEGDNTRPQREQKRTLSKAGRLRFSLSLSLFLLCFLSVTARAHLPGPPQTSKTARVVTNSKAPAFTLVNQNGTAFYSGSARGRVTLVTFVFTTCPDVCPLLTAKFAQLQRMLAREHASDFFLISITTDPEVDKPEVLKSYAQRYGADLSTWAFLTGEEDEMSKVWRSFGVSVKKKGKGLVQHTSLTTLIDRQGVRRINYYGDSWQEKDIFQDIQSLRTVPQPATRGKK